MIRSVDPVKQDRQALQFMIERDRARQRVGAPRCVGVSSDALAMYGIGHGERPTVPGTPDTPGGMSWRGDEVGQNYPHDIGDLLACQITYAMAPAWMRERMLPVLEEFEGWVRHRRNRYGETL